MRGLKVDFGLIFAKKSGGREKGKMCLIQNEVSSEVGPEPRAGGSWQLIS